MKNNCWHCEIFFSSRPTLHDNKHKDVRQHLHQTCSNFTWKCSYYIQIQCRHSSHVLRIQSSKHTFFVDAQNVLLNQIHSTSNVLFFAILWNVHFYFSFQCKQRKNEKSICSTIACFIVCVCVCIYRWNVVRRKTWNLRRWAGQKIRFFIIMDRCANTSCKP